MPCHVVHAQLTFMTVAAVVSYRCWWRPPLFLLSLWLFQSQRPADSDEGPAWRICPRCAVPLLHPRGWIIVPKGNYRIFEPPRQWRRPLQLLLSVDGYRRSHQPPVSLPLVRCAARWLPNTFYRDVNDWWCGPGICTGGSWRDLDKSWNVYRECRETNTWEMLRHNDLSF